MNDSNNSASRVLLIEDEVLVRMFAVDALEDAGLTVEQAGTGAEGLAKLEAQLATIAAVIIDLGLPDRPGHDVARQMRALRSDLPLLIASGRSERELEQQLASDPHVRFLVKPYTTSMLLAALEALGVTIPNA
jgi:DNA-binding response OmpR family regulator